MPESTYLARRDGEWSRHVTHQSPPARIVFGVGTLDTLHDESERLGARRVLVLSTPGHAALGERAAALLGERSVGLLTTAAMHVPADTVAAAVAEASRRGADATVAIGGGSTIGLAKALALKLGLQIVAVPTTYSGSEATAIHGTTQGGVKSTGRDPRALPRTVIYAPTLTCSLPTALAAHSGLNAMAQAAEGLMPTTQVRWWS